MSKQLLPEVRFKGFSGEWEEASLFELLVFSNGINAPKESYGKGRKMISVMDILDDVPIKYEKIRNSVSVNDTIENNNRVDKGDLVFVRSSEVVNEVGWTRAYLDEKYALYSGFSIRGKRKNKYDALFLELSINEKAREQIESKSGGSTRFNVNQAILNELQITMPDLSEQKEISQTFNTLNTSINSRQLKLTKLKNFKKAMLQKMFPKEGETEPEVRFEGISGEWENKTLDELLNKEFKGNTKKDDISDGLIEYLDAERLNGGTPYMSDGYQNVGKNDILIIWDGSNAGKVYSNFSGVLGSTLKSFSVNDSNYSEFIYQYLLKEETNIFNSYRTPNIPHVVRDFTSVFLVPKTTYDEQKLIGQYFNNLDKNINSKQAELKKLKEFKKAMLQKMFV